MSGCLAPARFFRYTAAEKDPISEVPEVLHPEADALEDLCFVVAALDEAVGPGDVHGRRAGHVEPAAHLCRGNQFPG